jgi:V8-like Glu-specific endopeptidase
MLLSASYARADALPEKTSERVTKATVMVARTTPIKGEDKDKWIGTGSGSFINGSGLVVTNNHVVDPAHHAPLAVKMVVRNQGLPNYEVVLNSGTDGEMTYKAQLKYQSESADLAILQVLYDDGVPLDSPYYLPLLPSDAVQEGDSLWCFGFPGGDTRAKGSRHAAVNVSSGNIRSIHRTPSGRIDVIETDVKAAPGNSGGPLVSAKGELMGVLSQGGWSHKAGDGIAVRIVPANLVIDMVRVASALGKMGDTDLAPFTSLARWRHSADHLPSLAAQLQINDTQLVSIADSLESGDLKAAGEQLVGVLERKYFKSLPRVMQDRARVLHAEHLLRSQDYGSALATFKRARRSNSEAVRWYARSRTEVLEAHNANGYEGQQLSDPVVFAQAASEMSEKLLMDARRTLQSYDDNRNIKSHNDWRRLTKRLKKHEQELWLANSLSPGPAEYHAYRVMRFQEIVNIDGLLMLSQGGKKLHRDIEDSQRRSGSARENRQRNKSLEAKVKRHEKQESEISRHYEDLRVRMMQSGFRLDDPAAANVLNNGSAE